MLVSSSVALSATGVWSGTTMGIVSPPSTSCIAAEDGVTSGGFWVTFNALACLSAILSGQVGSRGE